MRELGAICAVLGLFGCGAGNDDDSDTAGAAGATCEDYETTTLSSMDSTLWPAGLGESLMHYHQLDGVWEAKDCVDPELTHTIKITAIPQEQLEIVDAAPPAGLACGCLNDPMFGPDTELNPVALVPSMQVFVDAGIDPGIDNKTYEFAGALFDHSELAIRVCGTANIDPADNSLYDEGWITLRVDRSGVVGMSIRLANMGQGLEPTVCELTEWVRVADSAR